MTILSSRKRELRFQIMKVKYTLMITLINNLIFNMNLYFFICQFLKKFVALCQVPTKDDDEFCNIWQSLQGSRKVQHFQPTLQEKVSIPSLMNI